MKPWFVVGLLLLLSGCRVDRAPMDAAHAQRVKEIDQELARDLADSDARWDESKKLVLERRQFLFEIEPGTDTTPKQPVVDDFVERWQGCKGTEQLRSTADFQSRCEAAVGELYWRALGARYFKADFEWVTQQKVANPDLDIEWLATRSHNNRVNAEIDESLREIEGHKASFRASRRDLHNDEVLRSEQQRDDEVADAQRQNRAVWAAALRGVADGMSNPSQTAAASQPSYAPAVPTYRATAPGSGVRSGRQTTPSSTPPYGSSAPVYRSTTPSASTGGCSSDYSCGVGQRCVKKYYNSSGVCMRAVNEHGIRSYAPPDPGSIGPNTPSKNSCSFGTCPMGFRCDHRSGVCVK